MPLPLAVITSGLGKAAVERSVWLISPISPGSSVPASAGLRPRSRHDGKKGERAQHGRHSPKVAGGQHGSASRQHGRGDQAARAVDQAPNCPPVRCSPMFPVSVAFPRQPVPASRRALKIRRIRSGGSPRRHVNGMAARCRARVAYPGRPSASSPSRPQTSQSAPAAIPLARGVPSECASAIPLLNGRPFQFVTSVRSLSCRHFSQL